MKRVTSKQILKRLKSRKTKGYHVDNRLMKEVSKAKEPYLITIENKESFFTRS